MSSPDHLWLKQPIKDGVALAFFSGALGTIVMYSIGIPLYLAKIANWIYLLYSIELFVTPEIARTPQGMLAGGITGLIVGGALAFGFILLIVWTSSDWYWLKAASYNSVMWFVWVGAFRNLLGANDKLMFDLTSNIILYLQSLVYGLTTAYFITKLSNIRKLATKK